ncbi:type II toxin-antitoxin system death-on-curing family toxin [Rhizobium sp. RHZ01]|uniref:type II toxin-antitoxin system death-on-curing family toxin n=1 Tax=Rhizobium sp. RHZ01 TaxID=2769304 RepID=UPI00177CF2DD|nr:type II toxin-antitoxin system death-on-curing family toxin [Rhizobium sp. RHZ01]
MIEPLWLPIEAVVLFNEQAIDASPHLKERHLVTDMAKLAGAMNRPQASYHYAHESDILVLTADYMVAIGECHAFEQGNKRTGFIAGYAFLESNGYTLTDEADDELVAVALLEVLTKDRPFDSFRDYLEQFVVPKD